MSPKRLSFLAVLLSTICLCVPALINNFPFVYPDTATYLGIGFEHRTSPIRPPFYGVFLRHISMKESLWLVVLAQAFLVTFLAKLFIDVFFKKSHPFLLILSTVLFTLTTSIGITVGMLMPDFTTVFIILGSAIILYGKDLRKWQVVIATFYIWLAIASHHSHFYILCLILCFWIFRKLVMRNRIMKVPLWRVGVICAALMLGYLVTPTIHYSRKGKFYTSGSKNIFLMGRINQMGLLKPFLEKKCPEADYSICKYKSEIPDDFLWGPNTPVQKDGGWWSNEHLYGRVIQDFLTTPYFLKRFLIKTFETSVQQFFSFRTVYLHKLNTGDWFEKKFENVMPDSVPALRSARQSEGMYSNHILNLLQHFVIFLSMLFLLYFLYFKPDPKLTISKVHREVFYLILFGLISNAIICGGISMIAPRFQSRIIWVLPLFTFFIIHEYLWLNRTKKMDA